MVFPKVGWIIIYTANNQTKEIIEQELLSWLKEHGWQEQVKVALDCFSGGTREEIDLIAHIYQSNSSLSVPIGNSHELKKAIPTVKRWLTEIL